MHWTEPATAANMLWAGADLKPSEYSPTVLGLIFDEVISDCGDMSPLSRRDMSRAKSDVVPVPSGKPDLLKLHGHKRVTGTSRYSHLLSLPEGANVGQARELEARIAENVTELLAA